MEGGNVLFLLSFASYLFYFVFCILCLASGLYYLAEFVEEYIIFTKKVITRTLQVCCCLYLLCADLDAVCVVCSCAVVVF